MDTDEGFPARIRERRARPRRPRWIYRCRHPARDVLIDVDAFTSEQAAGLAAAHWGIRRGMVELAGKRRRWMRWIPVSTHDAESSLGLGRGWWWGCKMALVLGVLPLAMAYPVAVAVSQWFDEVREQRELEMAVQRAELERLQGETEGTPLPGAAAAPRDPPGGAGAGGA